MYLKNMMYTANIYTIWYIGCNSIFLMKLGWRNINGNVIRGTVSLKDTLFETKKKIP